MDKREWKRVVGWVAAASLLAGGCSSQGPSGEFDAEVGGKHEDVRPALVWGEFADHPMQAALQDCVFLTQEQLLLIHRVWNDAAFGEGELLALGEAFGLEGAGEGDVFARNRAIESARTRMLDEIKDFGDRPFCVDLTLYLDRYDFDRKRLTLAKGGASKFYRDVLTHRNYLSADPPLLDSYVPPLELRLLGVEDALVMPTSQAETLLGGLPKVAGSQSDEQADEAQEEFFTRPPTILLPDAAFEAFMREEYTEVLAFRGASSGLLRAIEARALPPEGMREASAVAVFRLSESSGGSEVHQMDEGRVRLGVVRGQVEQLLIFDAASHQVHAVWPPANPGHQGAQVEPRKADLAQHRALMEAACEGPVKEFRDMEVVDDELREVVSYGCDRCPGTLRGRRGPMIIDFVAQGSFSGPGAQEALVHSQGCYARNPTRGGVMTYLRRDLRGDWQVVVHDSVVWSECAFFPTSYGTSLPVCDEIPTGEDTFLRRYRTLQPTESKFVVSQLFNAGTDIESCGASFAMVSVEDINVVQNAQNEDELRFVVDLLTGRSEDGSPHCYEQSPIKEETTRLEFGLMVKRRDVVPSDEALQAFERIEEAL